MPTTQYPEIKKVQYCIFLHAAFETTIYKPWKLGICFFEELLHLPIRIPQLYHLATVHLVLE